MPPWERSYGAGNESRELEPEEKSVVFQHLPRSHYDRHEYDVAVKPQYAEEQQQIVESSVYIR